jgi:hypothetical protein
MKVFATMLENKEVVLKTWSSISDFNKTESWTDEAFIYIATSKEFKGDHLVSPIFDDDLEPDSNVRPPIGSFRIMHTKNQVKAHNLMCQARRDYMRKAK